MLTVIKHFVNDNACTSAWCAQRRVQQLLCKTLNFISPELWPPTGQRWTQLGSLYQQQYEFQVNKIEEIKQQLVEPWKSSNTTFE